MQLLTDVTIRGFRCFREISAELKPLTVLIGPHDTGKSAFLDALICLGWKQKQSVTSADFNAIVGNSDRLISVVANDDAHPHPRQFSADFTNSRKPSFKSGSEFKQGELERYQLRNQGVKTECAGYNDAERNVLELGSDGGRTAALLDHLLRTDLKRFMSFKEQLCRMVPGCEDLVIETPQPQLRRIDLIVDGGHRIPASRSSAGVRLLLFFLALVHHPIPPKVVLIEEPENGIHPRRLSEVMDLLRGLTVGHFGGGKVQVIVTTHSPYLLDCADLETDQVLIFQRDADGTRNAVPADKQHLQEFFDGFMLGEVWFNAQEAGLIGAP